MSRLAPNNSCNAKRPPLLNLLNAVAWVGGRTKLSPHREISMERLHESAVRATKLEDFGNPRYREGLEIILDEYPTQSQLSEFGWMTAWADTLRVLKNRLRLVEMQKRAPAIAEERIRAPLFIVGLPRTGTTLLHHLLALDPEHRALKFWQGRWPSPPPRSQPHADRMRKMIARFEVGVVDATAPNMRMIHPVRADGPEECLLLFQMTFENFAAPYLNRLPGYEKWLLARDMRPAYTDYRELLKLLQFGRDPKRWVLKSPFHLGYLDLILDLFPDAHIIQTHRDPIRVIPSMCSLREALRATCSDHVNVTEFGDEMLEVLVTLMRRASQFRENLPNDSILDIHFRDFIKDPMAMIERIYTEFGWNLSPQAQENMRNWLANEGRGSISKHRYAPDDYGLSVNRIRDSFHFYTESFGVEAESTP